jgi:MSHA biogenesis protein MshO
MRTLPRQSGFTLVEMILVIVITGIIGGIVATFLKMPVQGYVDSARRAELTDIADTAFRRMARDIRTAVPNSVRNTNCVAPCVEFIPTKAGGRYRADLPGNVMVFGAAWTGTFDIVGSSINFTAGASPDYIEVGNLSPYDQTTANGSLRRYTGATGPLTTVTIDATAPLSQYATSERQRFAVVDGTQRAVTYACEGALGTDANGNGTARLVRYWNYGFNAAPAGVPAILANRVSNCNMVYDVPSARMGLLSVQLTLTSGGESVALYNEIHVNNVP